VAQPAAVEYDPSTGEDPPYGASVNFYLKTHTWQRRKEVARLTITDDGGK